MQKRYFCLTLVLVIFSSSYPQVNINSFKDKQKSLEFELTFSPVPNKVIREGNFNYFDFNSYRDESKPGEYALPVKDIIIALPAYSKVNAQIIPINKTRLQGRPMLNPVVTLNDEGETVYSNPISKGSSGYQPVIEIKGYLWFKDYYCVHLSIRQYQFNNDFIEELNSARLTLDINAPQNNFVGEDIENVKDKEFLAAAILNYSFARPLNKKVYEPQIINSWFDTTKTYIKIGSVKDGLYKITPADINSFNINVSSIPLNTFKLIYKGIEQPVAIIDNGNNILDPGEYIEFIGLRNMGSNHRAVSNNGERYNEYLDRYSDTSIYWLTWGGGSGLRIPEQNSSPSTNTDTLKYYAEIIHYEENIYLDYSVENLVKREDPDWLSNETWVWQQQAVGTANRLFTTRDVFPNRMANAFYKVQDYATGVNVNSHIIGLSINSDTTVYDKVPFNRYAQRVVNGQFNSSLLINGENTLKTISFPTQSSTNAIAVDWYEVEYPRYLKAENDSLLFTIKDVPSRGYRTFLIDNINSSDIALYKFNPQIKKISDYVISEGKLFFRDTVGAGDRYCLVKKEKIASPVFYYSKTFSDLSSVNIKADYILMIHPSMIQKGNEYASFISQNYNVLVKTVNIFDVYDQFNYGFFSPEPIKAFLKSANTNWLSPKPAYVFFVGKATFDYYNNKSKYFGSPLCYNMVPSYGVPVSDTWFTVWDTTGALIPQMKTGRIPVSSADEFQQYISKHAKYLSSPYDDWNKTYLLFSSGNSDDISELAFLKNINNVIGGYASGIPNGGRVNHLYKTYQPRTNFGPYTQDQITNIISTGGVVISYLGHSGTQVWDNGIFDPQDLKNTKGRLSLISDFGCSTGKFAEPDIKCFAELFVNRENSDAIGYVGNASLGFFSTTSIFPPMFYSKLLKEGFIEISKAHQLAKINMLTTYGSTGAYKVFDLANTLFTDPILKLRIPPDVNLSIKSADIKSAIPFMDDTRDSSAVNIIYYNYGKISSQTFRVEVTHLINGLQSKKTYFTRTVPNYSDTIKYLFPVRGLSGEHHIIIKLDPDEVVNEIYKDDNSADIRINIISSVTKVVAIEEVNNIAGSSIRFLNPLYKTLSDSIVFRYADNPVFSNAFIGYKRMDTVVTGLTLSGLVQGKRYWLQSKLNSNLLEYGSNFSFVYDSSSKLSYYWGDSLAFASLSGTGGEFNSSGIKVGMLTKHLRAVSAGFNDGSYAVIEVNGVDYLPEGHLDGFHIAVFADSTLNFLYAKRISYWEVSDLSRELYKFLDTIPSSRIMVIANAGNSGLGLADSVRNLLRTFGSKYIYNVDFTYSWSMIGKKGMAPGSVPEKLSLPYKGNATVDSTFNFSFSNASLITNKLGPVNKWKKFKSVCEPFNSSLISFYPVGVRLSGVRDTLAKLSLDGNGEADLSFISTELYRNLQFLVYIRNDISVKAKVLSIKVEYENLPEAAVNFQSVIITPDTLLYGEEMNLTVDINNIGGSKIDTLKYIIERLRSDNTKDKVAENTAYNIIPGSKYRHSQQYQTSSRAVLPLGTGAGSFLVTLDPQNQIKEMFKENNIYSAPFYIKGDTAHPVLRVLFDGEDIYDGDFLSTNPKIKIELSDASNVQINDTSAIVITLNDKQVYFTNNTELNYSFNAGNPKMIVEYNPRLNNGEYVLKVRGLNNLSIASDSSVITKRFTVTNELQLISVYNYPNPFSGSTYFTFRLPKVPEEVKIRIFTIAGRLIKEILVKGNDLKYDFNSVFWDGKDSDGDIPANGVYLYKVILKDGDKKIEAIQKLTIIK